MKPGTESNARLTAALIPVFTDVFGFGMMLPLLPRIIAGMTGANIATAALYGGWLVFVFSGVQFFFAPMLGNLGDRFGRRPVILMSLIPLGLDATLLAFAPSVAWLFAGKILGGTIGGSYTAAAAYVADITPSPKRSRNFALLNAAVGSGAVCGPVCGGLLAQYSFYLPCYIAVGLSLAGILFVCFLLPESLGKSRRRSFEIKRANPLGAFRFLHKNPVVWLLALAMGAFYLAADPIENVWSYHAIEKFDWSEQTIGYSLGLMGLMFALVQGVICPLLLPRLGSRRSMLVGLSVQAATFFLIAFACRGWMLFALLVSYASGSIFGPAVQSLAANSTPDNEQGELQGGMAVVRSLVSVVAPLISTGLFFLFSDRDAAIYFPGAPFLLSSLMLICAIMIVKWGIRQKLF